MASKVQIILVDDLDGSEAETTVAFALDGADYEIDLSGANAAELRRLLAPYVDKARRAPGRGKRRAPAARTTGSSSRSSQIRAWARSQGIAVNARGRIPADLAAKYDAAHS